MTEYEIALIEKLNEIDIGNDVLLLVVASFFIYIVIHNMLNRR
jgi:hypothetical protein